MDSVRATRVREALAQAGLDALICRLPENVVFLTGYWPRNGFSYVVFPQQAEPTLILPEGEIEWAEPYGHQATFVSSAGARSRTTIRTRPSLPTWRRSLH